MLEFILKIQICPWALVQGPWFKTICGLGSCPEAGSRLDALSLPSMALVPRGLLWMPKGQLHPQKPAPRQDMGCQGLPGLPFPSADPWQWEHLCPSLGWPYVWKTGVASMRSVLVQESDERSPKP